MSENDDLHVLTEPIELDPGVHWTDIFNNIVDNVNLADAAGKDRVELLANFVGWLAQDYARLRVDLLENRKALAWAVRARQRQTNRDAITKLAERERCAEIAAHLNGWGDEATRASGLAEHIAKVIREQRD